MKSAFFLLAFGFGLGGVTSSRAQAKVAPKTGPVRPLTSGQKQKGESILTPEESQSWLFVLEQQTQWTLVVQSGGEEGGTTSEAGNASTLNYPHPFPSLQTPLTGGNTREPGNSHTTGNASGVSHPSGQEDLSDPASNVIVIEGNTDDLPLVDRQGKPVLPKVPKPSAPTS